MLNRTFYYFLHIKEPQAFFIITAVRPEITRVIKSMTAVLPQTTRVIKSTPAVSISASVIS